MPAASASIRMRRCCERKARPRSWSMQPSA